MKNEVRIINMSWDAFTAEMNKIRADITELKSMLAVSPQQDSLIRIGEVLKILNQHNMKIKSKVGAEGWLKKNGISRRAKPNATHHYYSRNEVQQALKSNGR